MKTNNNYKDIPTYQGNPSFYVYSKKKRVSVIIVFIILLIITFGIAAFLFLNTSREIIWASAITLAAISAISGYSVFIYHKKITISEEGVAMQTPNSRITKFFVWNDIEKIQIFAGVSPDSKINKQFFISTRSDYVFGEPSDLLLGPEYMVIQNKPEIIHCIKKYYKGTIENLHLAENWEKYISSL